MLSNYLIFFCWLLLLPWFFPRIRVLSNESALCFTWPKCWSCSFSRSNEFLGLIFFRIDWFDLLAVQWTLKSLLHHHNLNASVLQHLAFLILHLSHPYMTTGKTIALTRQIFVICCLVCHSFLPRSKCLNFMAAFTICSDFEAQENKICCCFHLSPSICHKVTGPDAMILVFLMLIFKSAFLFSSLVKRLFSSSSLSAIRVVSSACLRLLIFSRQSLFQLVIHSVQHFSWCYLHIS